MKKQWMSAGCDSHLLSGVCVKASREFKLVKLFAGDGRRSADIRMIMSVMRTEGKATMRHVAREADVAIGTVSRVLNHHPGVGPELIRKVRQAVAQTGYVHQAHSRTKESEHRSGQRCGDIGALFLKGDDATERSHDMSMLEGIERALALKERSLVVGSVGRDFVVPHFLTRRRVDGLVLISPVFDRGDSNWIRETYERIRKYPHVWINARPAATGGDLCEPDIRRAGFLAADYLAGKGHRWVGFFDPWNELHDPALMRTSFIAGAQKNAARAVMLDEGLDRSASGPDVVARLARVLSEIDEELRPTALFIPSHRIARLFSEYILRADFNAAQNVNLLTCMGDKTSEPDAGGCLTMIDLRIDSLSARAVDQLLWRLGNPIDGTDCVNVSVEPVVIERGSVAVRQPDAIPL